MKPALKLAAALWATTLVAAGCGRMPMTATSQMASAIAAREAIDATKPFQLLTLPDQGPGALIDAIKNAKSSVELEIYMITTSGAAGEIVNALIDRQKAGVDVRVILETQPFIPPTPPHCDVAPSLDINKKAREALVAGGVRVQYSSPRFKYTHEKAMLIDHSTAYVMTTNFTGAAFANNREYVVIDKTPADVKSLGEVFDADWNARPYQPTNPALVLSPSNSRSQLRDLIASATKSIAIEVEFATDPELVKLLGSKAKAGLDVSILISGQSTDKCTGDDIDQDEIKAFNAAGVTKCAVMKKLVLHAKAVVVDGQRAYVGSENLSANSLDNNRELGLILTDKGVVNKLATTLSNDWFATTQTPSKAAPAADAPVPVDQL